MFCFKNSNLGNLNTELQAIFELVENLEIAPKSQSGSFTFSVNPKTTTQYQIVFLESFASTNYTIDYTVTAGYYKDTMTMTTKTKLASGVTVNCYNSHASANATGTISWIAEMNSKLQIRTK